MGATLGKVLHSNVSMLKQRKIPEFSAARILVVGDVMLDRNWAGVTSRISPEAPVPVVNINQQTDTAGGAANVALNIASLGGQVTLCGLIGEDEAGVSLANILQTSGVQAKLTSVPRPTITKLRVLSRHQQLIRLDFESTDYADFANQLQADFATALEKSDVVIFSDYGKGTLAGVSDLIEQSKAAGKTVLVDPKGTDFNRYRGADIVTPNKGELEAEVGTITDDNLREKARKCLETSGGR